jgi:hypothetical protein
MHLMSFDLPNGPCLMLLMAAQPSSASLNHVVAGPCSNQHSALRVAFKWQAARLFDDISNHQLMRVMHISHQVIQADHITLSQLFSRQTATHEMGNIAPLVVTGVSQLAGWH